MKLTKYILLSLGIILILYIIIINFLFNNNFQDFIGYNFSDNGTYISSSGGIEKVNMGDSVSVKITRNRWYGTIYEENNNKILYLFKFIPLPIEKNNSNYLQAHIIFICLWWALLTIIFIFHLALKEESKENSNTKNI